MFTPKDSAHTVSSGCPATHILYVSYWEALKPVLLAVATRVEEPRKEERVWQPLSSEAIFLSLLEPVTDSSAFSALTTCTKTYSFVLSPSGSLQVLRDHTGLAARKVAKSESPNVLADATAPSGSSGRRRGETEGEQFEEWEPLSWVLTFPVPQPTCRPRSTCELSFV